jgi:hypothetical protein
MMEGLGQSCGRWKMEVLAKLRIFLWRLAKHSLPTDDVRHHRNMATSAACSVCGQEDSWRHSLIDCNFARCVWALTDEDITEHIVLSSEPAARQWIFSMIETMKKGDLIRMLVTLWAIWHARRKAIHEDVFQSPMATISFVNRFLADLEGCGKPVQANGDLPI